jgi:glutamate-ammonia-ligase adenylyltransferase
MNANHIHSLDGYSSSRFLNRWLAAKTERLQSLMDQATLSMTTQTFAHILQNEIDAGTSLNAAMRRTRNLVMTSLIKRDLDGLAELHEVVTTVSEFADFVVQTHLKALMDEMVHNHGTPIGEETGEAQELIVLGMGKLGGFELNVSSDIDLIFCYNEDGETKATGNNASSPITSSLVGLARN